MLTKQQAKQGARVTARAGWGFWSGLTFGRLRADAAGTVDVYDSPSRVYVRLDDGRRISTDARALELVERCDGCDHEAPNVARYRSSAGYGAAWCANCAHVARVERTDERIVAVHA